MFVVALLSSRRHVDVVALDVLFDVDVGWREADVVALDMTDMLAMSMTMYEISVSMVLQRYVVALTATQW